MRDLAPGDELKLHNATDSSVIVTELIGFQFDGFISLVAPGLTTTRYTACHDYNTGKDTTPEELKKPTLYYHGLLYNFFLEQNSDSTIIMGLDPTTSQLGVYDIGMNPDNCCFVYAITNTKPSAYTLVHDFWTDPPSQITQRYSKTATV